MTWQKVFVAQAAIEADLDIVVSDLDVAWLRDPRPLFALHPAADVLFSHDGTWTKQPPGSGSSEQLEEGGTVWDPVNAGAVHQFDSTGGGWLQGSMGLRRRRRLIPLWC